MNYHWLSRSLVIHALDFTCTLNTYNQGKVEEEDEKQNKCKVKQNRKQTKHLPLLLAETMKERSRVHRRCHSQHQPLSLTYMNLLLP